MFQVRIFQLLKALNYNLRVQQHRDALLEDGYHQDNSRFGCKVVLEGAS